MSITQKRTRFDSYYSNEIILLFVKENHAIDKKDTPHVDGHFRKSKKKLEIHVSVLLNCIRNASSRPIHDYCGSALAACPQFANRLCSSLTSLKNGLPASTRFWFYHDKRKIGRTRHSTKGSEEERMFYNRNRRTRDSRTVPCRSRPGCEKLQTSF